MTWLSFQDLNSHRQDYDALVHRTSNIDVFCSRSRWILPAQKVYAPGAKPFIWRSENAFVALMLVHLSPDVVCAMPLEIGWGLSCPLIGPDPDRSVGALGAALTRASFKPSYVMLTGIAANTPLCEALHKRFGRQMVAHQETPCVRRVAKLPAHLDGYLSRRSPKFRSELRRKQRQAERAGYGSELVTDGELEPLVARITAVEKLSWKGLQGQGVNDGLPLAFYRSVIEDLLKEEAFRCVFITLDGRDVAYAFGGIENHRFRGLQLSFDHTHAHYGVGNLAQLTLIQSLIRDGVTCYDLGMDMAYKRRWAESTEVTQTYFIAV